MRRALSILSLLTLTLIALANIGEAIIFTLGVTLSLDGQPSVPSPLATVAALMIVLGGAFSLLLSLPLSLPLLLVTFILGLIAAGRNLNGLWMAAIGLAGVLAFVGFFWIVWLIIGGAPVSFCTPFALVPLTTLAYCLLGVRRAPSPAQ
jgi:hypothetical protein